MAKRDAAILAAIVAGVSALLSAGFVTWLVVGCLLAALTTSFVPGGGAELLAAASGLAKLAIGFGLGALILERSHRQAVDQEETQAVAAARRHNRRKPASAWER